MSPFVIPPLMKIVLGAVGAAAVLHWVVREVQRINEELAAEKAVKVTERSDRLPKLRRDPRTGDYRPM